MRRSILTFALLTALVGSVSAQTPLERAKAALPPETARALDQTVASAQSRGLPTAPLVDKALEGIAKHAPPNVILDVVRQRLELLARADAVLRPFGLATANAVTAVADVMQRGISDGIIRHVAAGAHEGEPIDLALHTLADLLERGVPVDVAYEMLSSWRAHGENAEELRAMPAAVEKLVREGASPASAGRAIAASVRSGKSVGSAVAPKIKGKPDVSKPGKTRSGPPNPPNSGPPAGRGRKNNS